jgi:hypothetical protein
VTASSTVGAVRAVAVGSPPVSARRLVLVVTAWALTGVVVGIVAMPERCPEVTVADARAGSEAAVAWFERNQLPDGRWVYAHDRATGDADRSPHLVRHAGVTMSLYQAATFGFDEALVPADRGTAWALGRAVEAQGGTALEHGGRVPTGGAALLTAGLALRREATGDPRFDDEMAAMGRFLAGMVEPSGAVLAEWDASTGAPVPDLYSLFFTGEALWALVLLDRAFPDDRWDVPARAISRYLATERDRAEEWFPPVSDHWGAYGLADLAAGGTALDGDERDQARRLAGIFGIQVRYESQRTGEGLNLLLRGHRALGSGVGTLGEGLGALWQLTGHDPDLAELRPVVGERLRCVAGMLVERQVGAEEAAAMPDPALAEGAWFTGDRTQKDDQQHALSALLLAEEALAVGGDRVTGAGDRGLTTLLWLLVVLVAVANPVRVHRTLVAVPLAARRRGALGAAVLLAAGATMGAPLAGALQVSPTTLVAAAAIAVLATGAVDLVRRTARPLPDPAPVLAASSPLAAGLVLLRPATLLAVVALGAHLGWPVGAALGLLALVPSQPARVRSVVPDGPRVEAALARATGALALAGGLTLVVLGAMSP